MREFLEEEILRRKWVQERRLWLKVTAASGDREGADMESSVAAPAQGWLS